jgi:hypothetical protein
MTHSPERMWEMMIGGSEELLEELGQDDFRPAPLIAAIDRWLAADDAPLNEEEAARLGFLLARLLIEAHGGGLTEIRQKGHALDGEWAVTGFQRGLASDYHVPFLISAVRIGIDRSLTAAAWYAEAQHEGSARP